MSKRAEREAAAARTAEIKAWLWSLTAEQAGALREARDTPGGAYVPHTSRSVPMHELVRGGAASYREEHCVGEATRSVHDTRLCEWTDYYIVPTAYGLELLRKDDERRAAERARRGY